MCGICGQIYFKDNRPVDVSEIKGMTRALEHRGPDDEGFHIENGVGLGFRRLSIIDLKYGHQPMSDSEKNIWVVFNGEIYNFEELRSELKEYGYVFKTKSDTEVIVNGYKHWGQDVLNKLEGMFGLGIWDSRSRTFVLARDRMGIKPVYYKIENERIVFGSEIRAILSLENGNEPDDIALAQFLRYRYTPSPRTIFKNIMKLAPGTKLVLKNSRFDVQRWYEYYPQKPIQLPTIEDAEAELLMLYKRAVKSHLISDVPLGLLLSGGLDSGLLLALMNQNGGSWKTFTVGFNDMLDMKEKKAASFISRRFQSPVTNEMEEAELTAQIYNAEHYPVKLSKSIFEDALTTVVKTLEEPVTASSVLPMYFLAKHASKHVKVAFMGQGPDELFGGYNRHVGINLSKHWRALPGSMRNVIVKIFSNVENSEIVRRALSSLGKGNRRELYDRTLSIIPPNMLAEMFNINMKECLREATLDGVLNELLPYTKDMDELGSFQYVELRSTLPDELLMYADKMSMAHGLEVRVPYLDRQIVEFAESLPAHYKMTMFSRKYLHKRVCQNNLDPRILKRRKVGFATPVSLWFRESLFDRFATSINDDKCPLYDFLQPDAVKKIVNEHKNGKQDNSKIIFSLVTLDEWMRNYL